MAKRGESIGREERRKVVEAVLVYGLRVGDVAKAHGVSRKSVWKFVRRYGEEGEEGLREYSRRPHSSPSAIGTEVEERVLKLREERGWGAGRIGAVLNISGSTAQRVLREHGVSKLSLPRKKYPRYEMRFPGELLHVDVKELVPLRTGSKPEHLFTALDAYSREMFLKVFERANGEASWEFLQFLLSEVPYRIQAVMTDNALFFTMKRSAHPERECPFERSLREQGIRHLLTKPYTPRTNGKVERFFGTLGRELLRVVHFRDGSHRREELREFASYYNLERPHSAIGFTYPTPHRIQYFNSVSNVTYVSE